MKSKRVFFSRRMNIISLFLILVCVFVQVICNTNFRQKERKIRQLEKRLLRTNEEKIELQASLANKMTLTKMLRNTNLYRKLDPREIIIVKYSTNSANKIASFK